MNISGAGAEGVSVTVNEELAKAYIDALARLHELSGGKALESYSVTDLARFPEVLTVEKQEEDQDTLKEQLLAALDLALADFAAMRAKEGERLAEDILSRAAAIETLVGRVEERSPQTVSEYRARLEAKMTEVLQNTQIDESRLLLSLIHI